MNDESVIYGSNADKRENDYRERHIGKIIVAVWVIILAIIVAIGAYLYTQGYSIRRIVSDSMEPVLYRNDICIVKNTPIADVGIADIICIKSKDGEIIHRVMVRNEEMNHVIKLFTKGDNNKKDDAVPVTNDNYNGKVVNIITFKNGLHIVNTEAKVVKKAKS